MSSHKTGRGPCHKRVSYGPKITWQEGKDFEHKSGEKANQNSQNSSTGAF